MSDSNLVSKGHCDSCGSSDANALYDDGHEHCFSCGRTTKGDGEHTRAKKPALGLLPYGTAKAIPKRKLTAETCRKFGITYTKMAGKTVVAFNYKDSKGTTVAQKVRGRGKKFTFVGDAKNSGLFGQHLWRDKGKRVVITEGEIDAASISQLQQHKWPVVSINNGAQGARKSLQKALDWLSNFEEVVLCFDMDDAGRKAVEECAGLFKPGQCKIVQLPRKDANEMLVAGEEKQLIDALWSAKGYRPDGLIDGAELWDDLNSDEVTFTYPLPWSGLQEKLLGVEPGEVLTFCSGTGMGKSSAVRHLVYHFASVLGLKTGLMFFEEANKRTALGLMSIHAEKNYFLMSSPKSDPDYRKAFEHTVGNGNYTLYNHFGSTSIENVVDRIRFMAKAQDCKVVVVDHLSILISGMSEGDERRLIDNAMTTLKSLAMECGIVLILVSHLKRPEGKGHENGAATSLAQLRGSAAIGQLSDIVLGIERNQQDEKYKDVSTIRVLKSRRTGDTGIAGWLRYRKERGTLEELLDDPRETDGNFGGDDEPSSDSGFDPF